MAHTWQTNEVITAEKLNDLEQAAADIYAPYDAVIKYYHDDNSGHDGTFTILKGDFETIADKLYYTSTTPPNILVIYVDHLTRTYYVLPAQIWYIAHATNNRSAVTGFQFTTIFKQSEYEGHNFYWDEDGIRWW